MLMLVDHHIHSGFSFLPTVPFPFPLTKASLSPTVPPLSPTLAIGEVRRRQVSYPGAGGAEKMRETRFQEDDFAKKNQ